MNSTRTPKRITWPAVERLLYRCNFDASRLSASDRERVIEYVDELLVQWSATKIASFAGTLVAPSEEDERVAGEELESNQGTITFVWDVNAVVKVDMKSREIVDVYLGSAADNMAGEPCDVHPELPTNSKLFAEALELAQHVLVDEEVRLPYTLENEPIYR